MYSALLMCVFQNLAPSTVHSQATWIRRPKDFPYLTAHNNKHLDRSINQLTIINWLDLKVNIYKMIVLPFALYGGRNLMPLP